MRNYHREIKEGLRDLRNSKKGLYEDSLRLEGDTPFPNEPPGPHRRGAGLRGIKYLSSDLPSLRTHTQQSSNQEGQ